MAAALPLPAGLPLDATSWEQTPLVVRQVVVQLLAVIQQQEARIATLEAHASQNSSNSDRPSSSDPPCEKRTSRSGSPGKPGAKPGHPGHRQVLLAPTEVIAVKPEACGCGQREFPETQPYYTHQVIELPEIQMCVTHVVLHAAYCPQCSRLLKAELPAAYRYGYGPRLTALIGELSGSQRGNCARRDEAGTLARTMDRELGSLWTYVVEEGVEPTNNRAERALRFAVLWRKLMQGTYNEKGDRWVERILSLRETCRLRSRPIFPVLVDAVTCSFNGQHPDVSWISSV